LLNLLAAEITAVTGKDPGDIYKDLEARHGSPIYERLQAPAGMAQKKLLSSLSPEQVTSAELAGEPILAKITHAPGQRRVHRRAEGGHAERLVRGAALGHRGHVQDLCGELSGPTIWSI
jgi:phosphoglucomutase